MLLNIEKEMIFNFHFHKCHTAILYQTNPDHIHIINIENVLNVQSKSEVYKMQIKKQGYNLFFVSSEIDDCKIFVIFHSINQKTEIVNIFINNDTYIEQNLVIKFDLQLIFFFSSNLY